MGVSRQWKNLKVKQPKQNRTNKNHLLVRDTLDLSLLSVHLKECYNRCKQKCLLCFPWKCLFCIRTPSSLSLANISLWHWKIINQYTHYLMLLQLCIPIYCFCEWFNRKMREDKQEPLEKHHCNLKGSTIILNKLEKLLYHTERWIVAIFIFIFFQVQWQYDDDLFHPLLYPEQNLTPCSTCKSCANQHDWVDP